MTFVASPRTRNLSLSSGRAAPASTRAVAIRSAKLGFVLDFMGETSFDVCDLGRGKRVNHHRGVRLTWQRKRTGNSRMPPKGPELLRLFKFVASRYCEYISQATLLSASVRLPY